MYKTKANVVLIIMATITELVISILCHLGVLNGGLKWMLISAVIWGIIIVVTNSLTDFKKAVVFGLIMIVILAGVGQLLLMTEYSITYFYTQAQNIRTISIITKDSKQDAANYHLIMSYDEYDYYVDSGYTYIYKIKQNGLLSEISAFNIYIDKDVEAVFQDNFGDFYSLKDREPFENIGTDAVSISFVKNRRDSSAFVKIVSSENKVFYSYFPIDNSDQLLKDLGIVYEQYSVGSTNIVLSSASKIINGTQTEKNEILNYEDGKQYIISTNQSVFLSDATAISFQDDIGYGDRVNYFIYSDYILELEEYKSELDLLDPESDEAKEISMYIETLESKMPIQACELIYEDSTSDGCIRLYGIRGYSESLQSTPSITIIEIEKSEYYIYGYTNLELEDLF